MDVFVIIGHAVDNMLAWRVGTDTVLYVDITASFSTDCIQRGPDPAADRPGR